MTTSDTRDSLSTNDSVQNEMPLHRVHITRPFYLSKFEITQSQWLAVIGTAPWEGGDRVESGSEYPATFVTWEDANGFCEKLTASGVETWRLPAEAEWEYACRAGTMTTYSFGDHHRLLSMHGWFRDNAGVVGESFPHQVGQKKPNPFGLHDMHGNVWEWCSDWFDADFYSRTPVADPRGPLIGENRLNRGGGFNTYASACRSAFRLPRSPSYRKARVGFRVIQELPNQ